MPALTDDARHQRQWFIATRWQEYTGESRANLLRITAVGAFYVVQFFHYAGLEEPAEADRTFHHAATWIAAAWAAMALTVLVSLQRRVFPLSLKFFSTGADLVLLTALASLGGKASSPLVFAYFLIVALAALRFSLPLVWCATLGSIGGYLVLVYAQDDRPFDSDHTTPVVQQMVTALSLALTGVTLGQVIRQVKTVAEDYHERLTKRK